MRKRLSEIGDHGVCRVESVDCCAVKDRLVGMGIAEGAELVRLFAAPCGDPAAYSVRGAVVALRRSDAEKITVSVDGAWA